MQCYKRSVKKSVHFLILILDTEYLCPQFNQFRRHLLINSIGLLFLLHQCFECSLELSRFMLIVLSSLMQMVRLSNE